MADIDPKVFEELSKKVEEQTAVLGDVAKVFQKSIDQQRERRSKVQETIKEMETLKKGLDELDEAVKNETITRQQAKVIAQQYADQVKSMGGATSDVTKKIRDFGGKVDASVSSFGNLKQAGMELAGATATYAKDVLAAGQSAKPLAAAVGMAQAEIKLAGTGLQTGGKLLGDIGETASKSSNKWVKGFAFGSQLLGKGMELAGKASQIAGEALQAVTPYITAFQETYTKATAAGAAFGGGMDELRNTAGKAGMRMAELVDGIEKSQDAFQRGGLNFSQATKLVGNFGKGLVQGNEASQLFALGFTDASDRVALAGQAFDRARASGMSSAEAQTKITELTVQYGKDLKVLQGIVGKDAQKQMEKARLQSQRAALTATLNADQRAAFEQSFAALAALPAEQAEAAQKALMQKLTTGAVTDPAIATNEAFMGALEGSVNLIQSGSKDAAVETQKLLAEAGERARNNAAQYADIDKAVIMGAKGVAEGISNFNNGLMTYKADPAQGKEQKDAVNDLTGNVKGTTAALAAIDESGRKAQVALEQVATSAGSVKLFSTAVEAGSASVYKLIDTINSATKNMGNSPASNSGLSGALGGLLGPIGGIIGGITSAASLALPAMDMFKSMGGGAAKGGAEAATTAASGAARHPAGAVDATGKKIGGQFIKSEAGVAEKGAEAALKAGGKTLGKTALKAIPFVGLGLGLWDAAGRIKDGDYLGAAIAAGGAAASMFPGIGTGIALAADAANLARDVTGMSATKPEDVLATTTPTGADTTVAQPQVTGTTTATVTPDERTAIHTETQTTLFQEMLRILKSVEDNTAKTALHVQ